MGLCVCACLRMCVCVCVPLCVCVPVCVSPADSMGSGGQRVRLAAFLGQGYEGGHQEQEAPALEERGKQCPMKMAARHHAVSSTLTPTQIGRAHA